MESKDPQQLPSAPELESPKPQLIASTKTQVNPSEPVQPTTPALEDDVLEADEEEGVFDPGRGDHVDVLNDTTPTPPPDRYPETEERRKKRWPKVFLVLIILAIAGGGAYWFLLRPKPVAAPAKVQTSATNNQVAKSSVADLPTESYESTAHQLGLAYPTGWKIIDASDKLTATSPQTTFNDVSGKTVNGYIQVNIQNQQTTLPEFVQGSATAALESEKVSYKNPTSGQRAQTYISFASYATSTTTALNGIYVTGDSGYTQGQYIPMADVVKANPLISVKFLSCTDQTCSGTTSALSPNTADWKDASFSKPILTVIESLSLD